MNLTQFLQTSINESVRSHQIENTIDKLQGILDRHGVYAYKYIIPIRINNEDKLAVPGFNDKNYGVLLIWGNDKSKIESISFSKNFDNAMMGMDFKEPSTVTWDINIKVDKFSTLTVTKLIVAVMGGKIEMNRESILQWINGLNEEIEDNQFQIISEESLDELIQKKNKLYRTIYRNKSTDRSTVDLQIQYKNLSNQIRTQKSNITEKPKITFVPDISIVNLENIFHKEFIKNPNRQLDIIANMVSDIQYNQLGSKAKKRALDLLYKLSDDGHMIDLCIGRFIQFAAMCGSNASDRLLLRRLQYMIQ